jgi:hypothetical protein
MGTREEKLNEAVVKVLPRAPKTDASSRRRRPASAGVGRTVTNHTCYRQPSRAGAAACHGAALSPAATILASGPLYAARARMVSANLLDRQRDPQPDSITFFRSLSATADST